MIVNAGGRNFRHHGRARHAAAAFSRVWALAAVAALLAGAGAAPAAEQVRPEDYLAHVRYLASPEMEGRGAGTPGLAQAADYIAGQFRQFGLEPKGGDGSYLQGFPVVTGAKLGSENRFVVSMADQEQQLEINQHYVPFNFSPPGKAESEIVFAGYGITSEERGYDDYRHLDVKGKIVVVLRYEPQFFRQNENEETGRRRYSHHATFIAKAINARNHGAQAVILLNGRSESGESDKLMKFGSVAGPDDAGILMVQVKNKIAKVWFRHSGTSLEEVQKTIEEKQGPHSFPLSKSMRASLRLDIERERATVHNVAGYLPGETDEYIIVGAHYDHLGRGDHSSLAPSKIGEVHHGADDNASGVAGLIELARLFSSRQRPPRRGILFLAFAAEEIGLLGSAHWTKNPTLPVGKAAAMINMDMIGRIKNGKAYVGGVDTGAGLQEVVEDVVSRHDFKIDPSAKGSSSYSASDHTSFLAKQIPSLFFFSGLHSDYHKPSDTWDKVNAEAGADLVEMIAEMADRLAQGERLQFTKAASGHPHGGAPRGGGGGYGPWFGSIPDFGQEVKGVKFADITRDSPADKAGIRAGDVLIEFDGKPVTNLYDFTYALRDSKVGQTVSVKVLREGEQVTAEVTLEERR